MNFKLDENVPIQLKSTIKNAGHNASSVYEQNLSGKEDKIVFEKCKEEDYILITNDTDFESIYSYLPYTHPGIIVIKIKSQGIHAVNNAFKNFLGKVDLNRIKGIITVIGSDLIKIKNEIMKK